MHVCRKKNKLAKPRKKFNCFHLPLIHLDFLRTDIIVQELDSCLMEFTFLCLEE